MNTPLQLAVDIGGTFTDVALQEGTNTDRLTIAKVLTTPANPEHGVIEGIRDALARANRTPEELGLIVHGTTLATNAILERKGAKTALITTEGFRDVLSIAYENRYDQYDINLEKPEPLVPRERRFTVTERIDVNGRILEPLAIDAVDALIEPLRDQAIDSVAIGYLHAYANPEHEQRTAERLHAALPELTLSLSSEVCPEVREYERFSTTVANAYVRPLMARYLGRLQQALIEMGAHAPLLLMTSGGGLTTLDTARRFPIRLVESGPAGGAILASRIATALGIEKAISFDMGGTTAKICLLENAKPHSAREFEVDRAARFIKGSGLPLRIPVIEMVEIGAGGGSIARLDALRRITIGPDSAGADPGPACYARGGTQPTISDADVVLGKIDPTRFADGKVSIDTERAARALDAIIGKPLGLSVQQAAYGVAEMVDETMANAARVHAVEQGKSAAEHTLIAFGGAAPLHVARLADKLGIDRIVVPTNAGVGSAVGFLHAPIGYEVVRSRTLALDDFDARAVNALFDTMLTEARPFVESANRVIGGEANTIHSARSAYMRYVGQGHEILVELPTDTLSDADAAQLRKRFEHAYEKLYRRVIPNGSIEILTWALSLYCAPLVSSAPSASPPPRPTPRTAEPIGVRPMVDPLSAHAFDAPLYWRPDLAVGTTIRGPAVIAEAATSTFVGPTFDAQVIDGGHLWLERRR